MKYYKKIKKIIKSDFEIIKNIEMVYFISPDFIKSYVAFLKNN